MQSSLSSWYQFQILDTATEWHVCACILPDLKLILVRTDKLLFQLPLYSRLMFENITVTKFLSDFSAPNLGNPDLYEFAAFSFLLHVMLREAAPLPDMSRQLMYFPCVVHTYFVRTLLVAQYRVENPLWSGSD